MAPVVRRPRRCAALAIGREFTWSVAVMKRWLLRRGAARTARTPPMEVPSAAAAAAVAAAAAAAAASKPAASSSAMPTVAARASSPSSCTCARGGRGRVYRSFNHDLGQVTTTLLGICAGCASSASTPTLTTPSASASAEAAMHAAAAATATAAAAAPTPSPAQKVRNGRGVTTNPDYV